MTKEKYSVIGVMTSHMIPGLKPQKLGEIFHVTTVSGSSEYFTFLEGNLNKL